MHRRIFPDLVSDQSLLRAAPQESVSAAAERMAEAHVGAVLIFEDERMTGIFTERDLLIRVVAKGLDAQSTKLEAVMTKNPMTIDANQRAIDVLELMRSQGFRHVPVIQDGEVVGIVSMRDLYATVKSELEEDLREREAFIFDTGYGAGGRENG